MNMDNNNIENNLGSESLGGFQPTVNSEPVNTQGEDTFSPFQDLNNSQLNVPTESFDAAPVSAPEPVQAEPVAPDAMPAEPSFYQPEINQTEPVVAEPAVTAEPQTMETFNPEPTSNVDALNNMLNPEPVQTPTFETMQAAPVVENITPEIPVEPVVAAEPVVQENVASVNNDLNMPSATPAVPSVESPAIETPTMPIPDQMPSMDYQAGVSTPVDYATPMSDFDQIGTSPELDAKAKGKRKSNKLLLLILLLAVIGGLGYGCYYFINVKGILNTSDVTVKAVTAEKGEELSTNIADYATFKNTSSSNCTLDTKKVKTDTVGTYEFIITCGSKSYKGKVTVQDTKGPEIVVKTNIVTAGTTLDANMLVASANENAKYQYASESEREKFQTAGLQNLKIIATDDNGNTKNYVIPVIVTSYEYSMGIIATKDLTDESEENPSIIEKNVIVYNNSAGYINDTSYTAYIMIFEDYDGYKAAIKNYDDSGVFTYKSYTGVPVFYPEEDTIVIVKDINTDLIFDEFNTTYTNLKTNNYSTITFNQVSYKNLVEFNKEIDY